MHGGEYDGWEAAAKLDGPSAPRAATVPSVLFTRKPLEPADTRDGAPGPGDADRGAGEPHFVLGTSIAPPFPEGFERIVVGMGCFWGAERMFWQAPGVYTTAAGYAGGLTPNPTYEEVCSGVPATPRWSSRSSIRRRRATTRCSASSGRATTRLRACARATTSGRSTGRLSTSRTTRSRKQRSLEGAVPGRAREVRLRADHDGDRRGRPVLLRRGLPPAVPRQEPERLLRARRHGRVLPDRHRRRDQLRLTREGPRPGTAFHSSSVLRLVARRVAAVLARRRPVVDVLPTPSSAAWSSARVRIRHELAGDGLTGAWCCDSANRACTSGDAA